MRRPYWRPLNKGLPAPQSGASARLQPLVGRALLIALGVGAALLLWTAGRATHPRAHAVPHPPAPQFGGTFRRMLGANPITLDPAWVTDLYGRAIVTQVFDGLVQLETNLKPIPALAEFWEASRDG